jgi:hypothetical protein
MGEPKTLTVPEAGRVYFDLGRNASYEAARRWRPAIEIALPYFTTDRAPPRVGTRALVSTFKKNYFRTFCWAIHV